MSSISLRVTVIPRRTCKQWSCRILRGKQDALWPMWKYWIDKPTSKTFTEQKQQSLNGRDKRCTVLSRVLPNLRTCQVVETILRRNFLARCLLTRIKHWLVPTFFLTGTVGAGVNGLHVVREAEKIQRLTLLIFLVNPSWGHSLPPIHKKWIPASYLGKVRTKCGHIHHQQHQTAKLKFSLPASISLVSVEIESDIQSC